VGLLQQPGLSPGEVPVTPAPGKPLPWQEKERGCEVRNASMRFLNTLKRRTHCKKSWLSLGLNISTTARSCGERLKAPFPPAKHGWGAYTTRQPTILKCGFWDELVTARASSASPWASQQPLERELGAKRLCSLPPSISSLLRRAGTGCRALGSEESCPGLAG